MGRANKVAEEKKHKAIENDDVIKALKELGYDSYVSAFEKALDESKNGTANLWQRATTRMTPPRRRSTKRRARRASPRERATSNLFSRLFDSNSFLLYPSCVRVVVI